MLIRFLTSVDGVENSFDLPNLSSSVADADHVECHPFAWLPLPLSFPTCRGVNVLHTKKFRAVP